MPRFAIVIAVALTLGCSARVPVVPEGSLRSFGGHEATRATIVEEFGVIGDQLDEINSDLDECHAMLDEIEANLAERERPGTTYYPDGSSRTVYPPLTPIN